VSEQVVTDQDKWAEYEPFDRAGLTQPERSKQDEASMRFAAFWLLAASLQAQHFKYPDPPPPKGPQATCYWYSLKQDWFVWDHQHVNPGFIQINGTTKAFTERSTVPVDKPCKVPSLADKFPDIHLIGRTPPDKVEVLHD
jgi:hypothetical protein